jgi:hypothetical protein
MGVTITERNNLISLSPLTPVIIKVETNLPLIATALDPSSGGTSNNIKIVPAIFLKYKTDKERNDAIKTAAMLTFDAATIYLSGGAALATKLSYARRVFALIEVAGAAANIGVNTGIIPVNSNLSKAVEYYNAAMLLIGVKNIGKGAVYYAKNLDPSVLSLLKSNSGIRSIFKNNYDSFKAALLKAKSDGYWATLSDATKAQITKMEKWFDDLVGSGQNVSQITFAFKVGDEVSGILIKQIRKGNNGKIAIIGRKMSGHVEKVGTALKEENLSVELFNEFYQQDKLFQLDGQTYSWKQIVDDFANNSKKYLTNEKGYIIDSEIPKTLMYKANKEWAEKLVKEGYEIIDVGYPSGVTSQSVFYNMELEIIFK